jgi:hypothetical protein
MAMTTEVSSMYWKALSGAIVGALMVAAIAVAAAVPDRGTFGHSGTLSNTNPAGETSVDRTVTLSVKKSGGKLKKVLGWSVENLPLACYDSLYDDTYVADGLPQGFNQAKLTGSNLKKSGSFSYDSDIQTTGGTAHLTVTGKVTKKGKSGAGHVALVGPPGEIQCRGEADWESKAD